MIPYSDKPDGWIQLSCTLPYGEEGNEYDIEATVKGFAESMHLTNTRITNVSRMGNFIFVVFYAQTTFEITPIFKEKIEDLLSREEIAKILNKKCDRQVRILGACVGEDAHTVGLDAIFNMKGYHGDYGLERYSCFLTKNLGAQVSLSQLYYEIVEFQPDVICISQTVTQNDLHIKTLQQVKSMLDDAGIKDKVLICGGMHVTQDTANTVGFDFGFGRGYTAIHVANVIYSMVKVKEFALPKVKAPVTIQLKEIQKQLVSNDTVQEEHSYGRN